MYRQSFWIKPSGEVIHAPNGHKAYIAEHWQEHDLPEGIVLTDLIFTGWIRVSGDVVMLQHIDNPIVFEKLRDLLIELGNEQYTFWFDSKPYTVPLSRIQSEPIQSIYREIIQGGFKHVADASDAFQQGTYDQQPSWNETNSDGSDAMRDRGVDWMAQDTTPEVRWKNQLLDYLRKNFPGKKDVMPPEPDNGYPTQAFDVVKRMNKKSDSDVQDVIDRGYNLDDLKCRFCGSHEVVFNQGIGDASCQSCGRWQLDEEDNEQKNEQDSEWEARWEKRSAIAEREAQVGDTVILKQLKVLYGRHPETKKTTRRFFHAGSELKVEEIRDIDGTKHYFCSAPQHGSEYIFMVLPSAVYNSTYEDEVADDWEQSWHKRSSIKTADEVLEAEDANGDLLEVGNEVELDDRSDELGPIVEILPNNIIKCEKYEGEYKTYNGHDVVRIDREAEEYECALCGSGIAEESMSNPGYVCDQCGNIVCNNCVGFHTGEGYEWGDVDGFPVCNKCIKEDQDAITEDKETEKQLRDWEERWHKRSGLSKKSEEQQYRSDEEIESSYKDYKVISIQVNPSGNSGWIELEFPNNEDRVDHFIRYDDGRIAFEHWYPQKIYYDLEEEILQAITDKEKEEDWETRWHKRSSIKKADSGDEECDKCGGKATFDESPSQGTRCNVCEDWICDNCTDYDATEEVGFNHFYCKDCGPDARKEDEKNPFYEKDRNEAREVRDWMKRWHTKTAYKFRDKSIDKSIAMAGDPSTSPQKLDKLSRDNSPYVRVQVAQNANTLPETLATLSQDPIEVVRVHVAKNPNTPTEALDILVKDKTPMIRELVVLNPNVSAEGLYQLSKDSDEQISEMAKSHERYPGSRMRQWKERWVNRNKVQASLNKKANMSDEDIKESIERNLGIVEITDFESDGEHGTFVYGDTLFNWIIDEDTAIEYAKDQIRDDLRHDPDLFNSSFIEQYVDEERLLDNLWDDIDSMVKESPESYTAFIDNEEPEGDGDDPSMYSEDQIERMVSGRMDDIRSQGAVAFLKEEYGYDGHHLFSIIAPYLDEDEIAEGAISADGWQFFLSRYDGKSQETLDGIVYYIEETNLHKYKDMEKKRMQEENEAKELDEWEERWHKRSSNISKRIA